MGYVLYHRDPQQELSHSLSLPACTSWEHGTSLDMCPVSQELMQLPKTGSWVLSQPSVPTLPCQTPQHLTVRWPIPPRLLVRKKRFPTASGPSWGLSLDLRSAGRWDHDCDRISRVFIGTSLSTFSFRIHEEREILGFDPKTTYNRFCGDQEDACEQPTHWKVLY